MGVTIFDILAPLPPHTLTPSHPHILTPSHPQTLTPSHPHTLTPSHPHTLTLSHPHCRWQIYVGVTILDILAAFVMEAGGCHFGPPPPGS